MISIRHGDGSPRWSWNPIMPLPQRVQCQFVDDLHYPWSEQLPLTVFGRVWSIAATRRDALQGRLCAPLQRSPNLFLLAPSPTWMPASAVPGPS